MEKQVVDHLTLENLVTTTNTESLAKAYILNCRSEGKSPETIAIYETVLKNFIWYCRQNNFPKANQLTPVHIRHFLWYLSTESNRWGNNNPATRKPASQSTVSVYYRSLKTFLNWLTTEQLIPKNPMNDLKKPKPEKKVIQALSASEIDRVKNVVYYIIVLKVKLSENERSSTNLLPAEKKGAGNNGRREGEI